MDSKTWPAFAGGKLYVWTPLPGLDPGLGERAYRIAAAVYARVLASGGTEATSQQAAEREAFQTHYGLQYPTSV